MPVSPLIASAQLSLAAEFPDQAQARAVLGAIGGGERTFTNIARAAGGIAHSTLTRATDVLVDKQIVAAELPISLQPAKERRYRITDSYLRFYFAFLRSHLAEIDRMRSDLTLERIRRGRPAWRGRAIEPLVRESLMRLLPSHDIPRPPPSAATGPAATTWKSTSWARTASRSPSSCCSWARSSGWKTPPSTPTTS